MRAVTLQPIAIELVADVHVRKEERQRVVALRVALRDQSRELVDREGAVLVTVRVAGKAEGEVEGVGIGR